MELIGRKDPVSVGRLYEFRCQSVGARPAPHITWWRGSIQLRENVTSRVSTRILGLDRAEPLKQKDKSVKHKMTILLIPTENGLVSCNLGYLVKMRLAYEKVTFEGPEFLEY